MFGSIAVGAAHQLVQHGRDEQKDDGLRIERFGY
jgi:hypothetical protein